MRDKGQRLVKWKGNRVSKQETGTKISLTTDHCAEDKIRNKKKFKNIAHDIDGQQQRDVLKALRRTRWQLFNSRVIHGPTDRPTNNAKPLIECRVDSFNADKNRKGRGYTIER